MPGSPWWLLLDKDKEHKASLLLPVELIPQLQLRDLCFQVAVLVSNSKEFGCLARITTLTRTIPSSSTLPKRNGIKSDGANGFLKQGHRFACPQIGKV